MLHFPQETHAEIHSSMLENIKKAYTCGSLSCFPPSLQTLAYFFLLILLFFSFSFVFLPFTSFPKIEEHICNPLSQCHVVEVFEEHKLSLNPHGVISTWMAFIESFQTPLCTSVFPSVKWVATDSQEVPFVSTVGCCGRWHSMGSLLS